MPKGYEDLKGVKKSPLYVRVIKIGLYVQVLLRFTLLEVYLLY